MTPLGREIAAAIAEDGPISVARYMALCLGHPTLGYYATRDPFGLDGDFVTAPEISQIFGELLGLWAAEVWRRMGEPSRVSLIELGPGRGTLMADALRAGKAVPGFLDAAEVTLVETSPTLRAVQQRTLGAAAVRWADTAEEALAAAPEAPAIVLANEFFDALPVRQFVRTAAGWRERVVGLSSGGDLTFGLAPGGPGLQLHERAEGAVAELCPDAVSITSAIAAHISAHGGAALAIDYGYGRDGVQGDTLQAVRAHRYADPLAEPGAADLTTHVDFGALSDAAAKAGASPMRLIDQATLLERLGLAIRVERLKRSASPEQAVAIDAAAARLTDRAPAGMGALFKAFAFADPRLGALPAFDLDGVF